MEETQSPQVKARERLRNVVESDRLDALAAAIGTEKLIFIDGESFTLDEIFSKVLADLPLKENFSTLLHKAKRMMLGRILGNSEAERARLQDEVHRREATIKNLGAALKSTERRLNSLEAQTPFVDAADLHYLWTLHNYGMSPEQIAETFGIEPGTVKTLLKKMGPRSVSRRFPGARGERAMQV